MEQKFCRNICYHAAYRHLDNLCLFSRARIKTWMSVKSNTCNCFLGTNHHMPMLVCTNIDHGEYVSFCKYRYTHFSNISWYWQSYIQLGKFNVREMPYVYCIFTDQQNKIHHLYWFYIIQSIKNQKYRFCFTCVGFRYTYQCPFSISLYCCR